VSLVVREGLVGGDVGRGRATLGVELEPGEGVVEPAPRRLRKRPTGKGPEDVLPVDDGHDIHAGVGEDGPAESVEGAHTNAPRFPVELGEGSIGPLLEPLGSPPIEGQRADGRGVGPVRHTPGQPGDDRRGLARAGGRDTEDRARVRGGRRALVRGQSGEPLLERHGQRGRG
jgi:hypothetical protein